jgi:glycosyltransferase involved in cell wall biosynthesis
VQKLAFYYHIAIYKKGNLLFVPSFLGVFLDSLATNVEVLYLIMHEAENNLESDYLLKSANIKFISLGAKTPAWHRMLFSKKIIKQSLEKINHVNHLIVRSPSPLSPFFHKYFDRKKITFMIVGDYSEGSKQMKVDSIRNYLIKLLLAWNDYLFKKQIKYTKVLVNSPALFEKYKPIAKSVFQIKTTTLSSTDFFERFDTCSKKPIKLLFTGRIDLAKGLVELIKALEILNRENTNYTLDLVGWETDKSEPIKQQLLKLADQLNQTSNVRFYPKMQIGEELNSMYRGADIYVIPSYHEGFPRTIWEAMANSCPVIATKVGSIPYFLNDKENAILIEPKNISDLVLAIKNITNDAALRQRIIKNAFVLSKDNTLENQTKILIDNLEK